LYIVPLIYTNRNTMKDLLKLIEKEFDLSKCNTTFAEISAEIDYIQETYIHDADDLLLTLAYINSNKEVQLVFSN